MTTRSPERASHFPAIEKKYGKPMSHWHAVMKKIKHLKYPEQMAILQEQHGFSRTHANALVQYSRGSTSSKRFETFDQYLATLPEVQAKTVSAIFKELRRAFPDLELVMAWNQPMLKSASGYVFGASAATNYLLIAPFNADVIKELSDRLTGYKLNKKTIQVPSDWKVEKELLRDLVSAVLARVE